MFWITEYCLVIKKRNGIIKGEILYADSETTEVLGLVIMASY